jgi:ketosteroid isomerase-like protein
MMGTAAATAPDAVALQPGRIEGSSQPSTNTESTEKVLGDLERQWDHAVRTRDTDALNRLMADDFRYLSPFSASQNSTKEQQVKMFADLKAREKAVTRTNEITDTSMQVSGDTAIVTGGVASTSMAPDGETRDRGRFIHVWQKRGGQWRIVADHWDYEGTLPPPVKVAPVDTALLDAYAGRYDSGSPTKLNLSKVADGLAFKIETEGGWTETFLPASSTEFFGKTDGDTRGVRARRHRPGFIGPNDMLVAAQALSRGLVVVTDNVGEFRRLKGLKLETWTA